MNSAIKTIYRAVFTNHTPKLTTDEGTYKVEIRVDMPTMISFDWPPRVAFFKGELIEVVVISK